MGGQQASGRRSAFARARSVGLIGVGVACAGISFAVLSAPARGQPAQPAQGPQSLSVYLPASMKKGALVGVRPLPSATRRPPATATEGPTSTRTPLNDASPTPSTTPAGGDVGHADDDTIILQIGITETDQPSGVWEEMNGTPWFTLYGDGTVIASKLLPDPAQALFTARVSEEQIQVWLRELSYGVNLYNFPDDPTLIEHAGSLGKPVLHFYMNTTGGRDKLVELRGFRHWERRPPDDHPWRAPITRLLGFTRGLEAWGQANLTTPYEPEEYALIVQHQNPELLPEAPPWDGIALNPIAMAAPTAASNYVDHVPAHKFIGAAFGRELQAIVEPEWRATWGIYNLAAEFDQVGRHYAVGIRQELPGESLFLPAFKRANWWRRDADDLHTALEAALDAGWVYLGGRPDAPFALARP